MTPELPASAPDPAFGPTLRRERERRGITLDAIADETKISAALLAGLEDDDLSRWPSGIFRRAFVKSYAEAIGLDATRVLADFLLRHPDQTAAGTSQLLLPDINLPIGGDLRLTLEEAGPAVTLKRVFPRLPARVMAISVDVTLVVVLALAAGAMWGRGVFWIVLGPVSILYQLAIAARPSMSPGNRLFDCEPRRASECVVEEEFPVQASLQFTPEWSERLRQGRRDSAPEI